MGLGQIVAIGKAVLRGKKFSNNIWKPPAQIDALQAKRLKAVVTTAYNETDFYRRTYDAHGVKPEDIQSAADITKLPIITKQDIVDHFEETVPRSLDRTKAYLMGTSGSTGKPLQVYKDRDWVPHFLGFGFAMRRLHKIGLHKVALIMDVGSEASIENQTVGFAKYLTKGALIIPVDLDISEMMSRLEKSNVRYIATYTGIMRELATLRKNGRGQNLNLKKIGLTGEILDDYTRAHVEEAFGCPCYSGYLSTEGGPIALECENKKMHVYSDSMLLEVVDEKGEQVPRGQDGNILLTALTPGLSTPIIRYSGCADVGQLLDETCDCGIHTPIMGPVQGRKVDSIRLPNGKVYHAFSMTIPMEKIQKEHGKDRLRQYQIVQHAIDRVTISLVRNAEKAGPDDALTDIMGIISKAYQKQLGPEITIDVKEVDEIPKGSNLGMPTPLVLSKVKDG